MGLRQWVGSLASGSGSQDGEPQGVSRGAAPPGPPPASPGPNLEKLSRVARQAHSVAVSAELVPDLDARIRLSVRQTGSYPVWGSAVQRGKAHSHQSGPTLADVVTALVKDVHDRGRLDVESITCRSEESPLRGTKLKDLCVAALCETFGEPVPTPEELAARRKARRAAALKQGASSRARRKELLSLLAGGPAGVRRWNRAHREAASLAPFKKVDLEGKDLSGARLVHMPEGRFAGATLVRGDLRESSFRRAGFTNAGLQKARLIRADLREARFTDAHLEGADLSEASLQGADFTGAHLDHVTWRAAVFDERTVWPAGFDLPEKLIWAGEGPDPAALAAITRKKGKTGPVDLAAFMKRLEKAVDKPRLQKALSMLKKDRFQLFVETSDEQLSGVVKSQSDPELVYSGILSASGAFSCCTQNLNVCGGLRGALCKHLLVLVVGLAQSGEVSADTLDDWVQRSTLHKPALQKDVQSAVLLRYKGAEAGEIDWRPTETVPEDFYAY